MEEEEGEEEESIWEESGGRRSRDSILSHQHQSQVHSWCWRQPAYPNKQLAEGGRRIITPHLFTPDPSSTFHPSTEVSQSLAS